MAKSTLNEPEVEERSMFFGYSWKILKMFLLTNFIIKKSIMNKDKDEVDSLIIGIEKSLTRMSKC